jgi:putative transposase
LTAARRSVRDGQNWSFTSDMVVVAAGGWIENLHMLRYQSYKFELRPTGEQLRWMRRIAGCCRFVLNLALATQKDRKDKGLAELDFARFSAQLLEWRRQPESIWLADVPIGYLQQALRNLERSYARFNSAQNQAPKFKKRGRSDSFRCCNRNDIKVDQANSRILLPKLGWVRYRNSREMHGRLTNVTISVSGDKWFASILVVREVQAPVARGPAVGIDMGIVRFATLSDGTLHMPLNSFRRLERALAVAQRSLSRKTKYSNNWRKEKVRVQRIHVRIGNARRDYLHKISTSISQNHAVACIEDLKVSAMSRSATRDQAAANVRGKRKLNKSILDQGWFEFRRQLEYKMKWNGGRLIAVSPRNTSITCPRCRHISKENRRNQAEFVCGGCGFQENADLVGALNVLRAGHARIACAETSPAYEALGQEPTDALPQGL